MGPGILPTRDFGDGHAVYEKAAMLGKRRCWASGDDAAAGRGAGAQHQQRTEPH